MKNMKYISMVLCALFFLTACEKETEGISGVMYFELLGAESMNVTLGTSYQEPGCKVLYRDQDVTKEVKVTGTVNAQVVGLYSLDYSYFNKDGVRASKKRTVIVADPNITTDIAGSYVTAAGTFRLSGTTTVDYPGFNVTITKIAPGFFKISDFLGGYYAQRGAAGAAYACNGYVELKSNNTITLLSSSILPWGDTLTGITESKYNPATGVVSWKAEYAGMFFTVVLNKK